MDETQTVLITGASSGIGAELARVFAGNGYKLVLTARREERLRKLASELGEGRATVIAADLCAPDGARALHDRVTQAGIHVDVLVNNAGLGGFGLFAGQSLERQAEMMQVNMVALTCLSRLFLPGMIGRHRGGILNVASMAAYQPGPLMSVYYASKAYVLSLSEALAEEVRGQQGRGLVKLGQRRHYRQIHLLRQRDKEVVGGAVLHDELELVLPY